jgi:hypothetical protein
MLLSPIHHQWGEFLKLLRKELNFRKNEFGKYVWNCENNFDITEKIINYMGGFDSEKSIKEIRSWGAGCDCEIVLIIENELSKNKIKN